MMEGIFLLLGSNQGDRRLSLSGAQVAITEQIGPIINSSSIHMSSAWGHTEQPDFLNQVVEIRTELEPVELLDEILKIEIQLGRIRFKKWGPRIIDIDILYYGNKVIQSEGLTIPHMGIPARRFTLEPLKEIAPDFVHPVLHKTNTELLILCNDSLGVQALLET
jgi:2-amino-4-hydroxy-6-hydroxymethyldihydropteridine diphosphokinase